MEGMLLNNEQEEPDVQDCKFALATQKLGELFFYLFRTLNGHGGLATNKTD